MLQPDSTHSFFSAVEFVTENDRHYRERSPAMDTGIKSSMLQNHVMMEGQELYVEFDDDDDNQAPEGNVLPLVEGAAPAEKEQPVADAAALNVPIDTHEGLAPVVRTAICNKFRRVFDMMPAMELQDVDGRETLREFVTVADKLLRCDMTVDNLPGTNGAETWHMKFLHHSREHHREIGAGSGSDSVPSYDGALKAIKAVLTRHGLQRFIGRVDMPQSPRSGGERKAVTKYFEGLGGEPLQREREDYDTKEYLGHIVYRLNDFHPSQWQQTTRVLEQYNKASDFVVPGAPCLRRDCDHPFDCYKFEIASVQSPGGGARPNMTECSVCWSNHRIRKELAAYNNAYCNHMRDLHGVRSSTRSRMGLPTMLVEAYKRGKQRPAASNPEYFGFCDLCQQWVPACTTRAGNSLSLRPWFEHQERRHFGFRTGQTRARQSSVDQVHDVVEFLYRGVAARFQTLLSVRDYYQELALDHEDVARFPLRTVEHFTDCDGGAINHMRIVGRNEGSHCSESNQWVDANSYVTAGQVAELMEQALNPPVSPAPAPAPAPALALAPAPATPVYVFEEQDSFMGTGFGNNRFDGVSIDPTLTVHEMLELAQRPTSFTTSSNGGHYQQYTHTTEVANPMDTMGAMDTMPAMDTMGGMGAMNTMGGMGAMNTMGAIDSNGNTMDYSGQAMYNDLLTYEFVTNEAKEEEEDDDYDDYDEEDMFEKYINY